MTVFSRSMLSKDFYVRYKQLFTFIYNHQFKYFRAEN